MYDSIKTNKIATLILKFMDEETEENPKEFIILDKIIPIEKNKSEYKIIFDDKSLNENKIYECFLKYNSEKLSFYIKINYGQDNHYIFGRKKNKKSFEFIFFDFANKKIDNNRCYIKYNKKKYFAYDDKNFLTLRNINLVNVDLDNIDFPLTYKNESLSKTLINDKSFLILISLAEETSKIFGVFQNNPFQEKKTIITANEVCAILEPSIKAVQDVLNYNETYKTYSEFSKEIKIENIQTFTNEIKNSQKLEMKVIPFFIFYRHKLTAEEIKAFNIYSEFMITFPSLQENRRTSKNINSYKYYRQYFASHKVIEDFLKTIPENIDESQKALLKYSASRCLRTLLLNGKAYKEEKLFYYYDINTPGTFYNEAKKFNEKFIKELNEKSEIYLYLLQINSGSGINKLTNDLTARMSMLTIEQVKSHLLDSLPDYIIRIKTSCDFRGLTFNETKCTFISEKDIFNSWLDDSELNDLKLDQLYNYRFILSNLLAHERFGHVKFSINFYSFKQDYKSDFDEIYEDEPLSPRQFYQIKNENNEKKEILIQVVETEKKFGEVVEKGEAGQAFNVFLTRGNIKNFDILRCINVDFSEIFEHPEFLAAEDLTKLNELLKKLEIEETSNYEIKKISEEKYELKKREFHEVENFPTTPKFHLK
jgi:hypothetical protein